MTILFASNAFKRSGEIGATSGGGGGTRSVRDDDASLCLTSALRMVG
jgi:hypothetical protein